MSNFRKALTSGLKAAPVVSHPDAELLAAFAEYALSAPLREEVIKHLADCSDCRQVVFLMNADAVPATVAAAQARKVAAEKAPSHRWRSWFAGWRWAVAGACAALVVVAVTVLRLPGPPPTVSARVQPPALPQTQSSPENTAASLLLPKSAEAKQAPKPLIAQTYHRSLRTQRSRISEKNESTAIAGIVGGQHAYVQLNQGAEQTPQAPAAKSQVQVSAAPTGTPVESQTQLSAPVVAPAPAPAPAMAAEVAPSAGATTATPVGVGAAEGAGMGEERIVSPARPSTTAAAPARRQTAQPESALESPQPQVSAPGALDESATNARAINRLRASLEVRISSRGRLQQSFDKGATWLDLVVGSFRKTVFHAISRIGDELWAGGSGGTLLHSTDGGLTWAPVVVSASNTNQRKKETSTITGIEFRDASHGEITTDSGRHWTTDDGGQHWTLNSQ